MVCFIALRVTFAVAVRGRLSLAHAWEGRGATVIPRSTDLLQTP